MGKSGTTKAHSARALAALSCLAALSAGCGDNDSPGAPPVHAIAGCESIDLAPCETRQFDCQLSRLALAACLRGTQPSNLPTITVMTEQEYADYMNALYEGTDLSGTNHFELAMTWLGLAKPGSFSFMPLDKSGIADWFGTYRWRQKDVLLIDHGKPANDAASNIELVAALVRSLRDRDINIAAWSTIVSIVDVDSNWAADALYFGEARFYANRYKAALGGLDPQNFDELGQINEGIRQDVEWIKSQPSSFVATNDRFHDNFGARFVYLAHDKGGVSAVDSLYDAAPFTLQIMASENKVRAAPQRKLHERPAAPSEWNADPTTTAIGAWGLFLSLSRDLPLEDAWSLALGWRGDQIYVYRAVEPADETALVWQLEAADEDAAAALEDQLRASNDDADVRRSGTFVTLAKTTDDSELDWAFVED